jgi:hypothetical protein
MKNWLVFWRALSPDVFWCVRLSLSAPTLVAFEVLQSRPPAAPGNTRSDWLLVQMAFAPALFEPAARAVEAGSQHGFLGSLRFGATARILNERLAFAPTHPPGRNRRRGPRRHRDKKSTNYTAVELL